MAARKAARVLPEPVGAAISTCRPACIAGHASACAAVGAAKRDANQSATAGWKPASAASRAGAAPVSGGGCGSGAAGGMAETIRERRGGRSTLFGRALDPAPTACFAAARAWRIGHAMCRQGRPGHRGAAGDRAGDGSGVRRRRRRCRDQLARRRARRRRGRRQRPRPRPPRLPGQGRHRAARRDRGDDRGGRRRTRSDRRARQQCRRLSPRAVSGDAGSRLGLRHQREPEGIVLLRPGGGANDGRGGARRCHRQPQFRRRLPRLAARRALLREQGRHRVDDAADGARTGAAPHPRQRDRAGPDRYRAAALWRQRRGDRGHGPADPARPHRRAGGNRAGRRLSRLRRRRLHHRPDPPRQRRLVSVVRAERGSGMDGEATAAFGIGRPVRRKEDFRLLTGRGRFVDDTALPGMAHAVLVRSPHAHARIAAIDTAAARSAPGVLAVLTGADYLAEGLGPIPHNAGLMNAPDLAVRLRGGAPIATTHHPMPAERVRFVGEPVALVVADTIARAKDAAELVDVTYEPLPAVARAADALAPGAPVLWPEAPENLCIDIEVGDEAATAATFARAAHVVRFETWVQRVTGVPMEPRTNIAEYDAASGCYTLHSGSGRGVAKLRLDLAQVLGVAPERVRVVCGDMGGNFGTRNFFYPEYALLAWAARRTGRPVKWTCERSESFLSDYQGRDLKVEAELALDADGTFLAVRGENLSNLGGHAASFVSLQKGLGLMSGVYRIPVAYFRGRGAVTNTVSTTPYRSAGRPEVIFVVERLIDLAADRLGVDPVELRRRNIVPPEAQPYTNPLGLTYDSGRYEDAMNTALHLADWAGFAARRAAAKRRGRLRGIGIANYVEITSGAPRERTEITVLPD